MKGRERVRRYIVGAMFVGAFMLLTAINERAVVKADDEYCTWDAVAQACSERPNNPCSANEGYRCLKQLKVDSCWCVYIPG